MRKSVFMGLGLAATLAGIATAQQPAAPRNDSARVHHGGRGPGGGLDRRGPGAGLLFKDITLTEVQKTAAKAIMQRNRQAMEQERTQQFAAIRNVLTADQRVQFDKNVEQMKQMQAKRGERFGKRAGA